MRQESQQILDRIDERFLAAVHALLKSYDKPVNDPIIGYDMDGQPKYASKMKALYDAEVRAALDHGDYMTIEDFEKESEQW